MREGTREGTGTQEGEERSSVRPEQEERRKAVSAQKVKNENA